MVRIGRGSNFNHFINRIMSFIEDIRMKAASNPKRIVLPRSSDERVVKAAEYLKDHNLALPILIQNEGATIPEHLDVIDPISDERLKDYAASFYEKRKHKGITEADSIEIVKDPLFLQPLCLQQMTRMVQLLVQWQLQVMF